MDEQNTEPCKLPTGKTLQKRQVQQSEETVPTKEPLYSYCHLNIGLLLSFTSSNFVYLCNSCALQTSRSTQMSIFCRSMMTGMRNYHYHAISGSPVYRFNNIKKTNDYHSTTTVSSRSFAFPWYFIKSLPSLNKMPQATQVFLVFLDTLDSVSEYWLSIPWLVSFLSYLWSLAHGSVFIKILSVCFKRYMQCKLCFHLRARQKYWNKLSFMHVCLNTIITLL